MSTQSIIDSLSKANKNTGQINSDMTNANPSSNQGNLTKINTQLVGITKNCTGIIGNGVNIGNTIADVSKKLGMNGLANALTGENEVEYLPDTNTLFQVEYTGETTGLKGFYSKFSGRSGMGVDNIDAYNTFECWFDFEPLLDQAPTGTFISNIIKSHYLDKRKYNTFNPVKGKYDKSQVYNDKIQYLDMGIYVQKFTIPNITTNSSGNAQSMIGEFPLNGTYVTTDSHNLILEVLNLRNPIHEMLFYPWMREVQMNKWQYDTQPYTTANIHIELKEHSNVEYVFLNCRPSQIMTQQPSNEPNTNYTRQITFIFDYMCIKEASDKLRKNRYAYGSDSSMSKVFANIEGVDLSQEGPSTLDKILDVAGATNFAASNILKI